MAKKSFIPEGYHAVRPSLSFKGTGAAISWYASVFGAKEKMRMSRPDQKIMHAELIIGDSMIFLAEETPEYRNTLGQSSTGNSIKLHVYVDDVDAVIKKAVQNGAKLVMPTEDQFYGDRCGCIDDPFGYTWILATHIKDVSEKEMQKRMDEMAHEPA